MTASDSTEPRRADASRAAGSRGSRSARSTGQRTAGADRAARPYPATALKREQILEAAAQVFATQGYHKGSLAEIADMVGMTHAGVLHYFGTKDQLLIAMLERRDRDQVKDFEGGHAPVGAALLDHLVRTAELNSERAGIVQTYAVLSAESVTTDHPAQPYFRDRFTGLRRLIADAFRDAVPAGVPEEKLEQAASSVIAVMDGLQVQWLLNPGAVDMTASVAAVIESMRDWLGRAAPVDEAGSAHSVDSASS